MKNKFLFACFLFILNSTLTGQTISAPTLSLSKIEQQSIMFKNDLTVHQYDYQSWKKGMAKEKRKTIIKGTIYGLIIGAILGASLDGLAKGSCEIVEATTSQVFSTNSEPCPSQYKRTMIGGGIGLLIGLAAGQEKAKKLKFVPNHSQYNN